MDVTANLATSTQLSNWMSANIGSDRANVDQWCYSLVAVTGCPPCPAPEYFGYSDAAGNRFAQISAANFLESLRNYQLSQNATFQGPGGSGALPAAALPGATGVSPAGTNLAGTGMGLGLLGPTNCQFCIWLKKNPWALVVAAAAIYFGFFYKK